MSNSLGRGLQSLIPKKGSGTGASGAVTPHAVPREEKRKEIREVPPSSIKENPHQPRKTFEEQGLADLVESIRVHGILQPLVVTVNKQGEYELIAGERRLRAARQLHLKSVPVIVRTAGELEKLELSLIENIQRKDLNPIERAVAYQKLIHDFSLTQEEAARRLGKSRSVVANTLRLLQLPGVIQKAIAEGKVTEGQAKVILELQDEDKQLTLFERIQKEGLTVRDVERVVKRTKRVGAGFISARRVQTRGLPLQYHDYEQQLSESLGTKVSIRKKGKGGMIEIEWYSEEDLGGIVRKLEKR